MHIRLKITNIGEVAILPHMDYEALGGKAQEADEDFGHRLLWLVRVKRLCGTPLIRNLSLTELLAAKTRCVCFASGAAKHSSTSRIKLISDRVTFQT